MTLLQKAQAVLAEKNAKIVAGNLKSGVTAFGVTGSVIELEGETVTVTPSDTQQEITPSTGNGFTQVTVETDANLLAENIKSGVTIFGVTGTYSG